MTGGSHALARGFEHQYMATVAVIKSSVDTHALSLTLTPTALPGSVNNTDSPYWMDTCSSKTTMAHSAMKKAQIGLFSAVIQY